MRYPAGWSSYITQILEILSLRLFILYFSFLFDYFWAFRPVFEDIWESWVLSRIIGFLSLVGIAIDFR